MAGKSKDMKTSKIKKATKSNSIELSKSSKDHKVDDADDVIEQRILRPFAVAIIGTDIIFLTTIIQKYPKIDVPQFVPSNWETFLSPFTSLICLSLSILFAGFWYVAFEIMAIIQSNRPPGFLGEMLNYCWILAVTIGLFGIATTISLVNLYVGIGFGVLYLSFVAIIVWIIWRKLKSLQGKDSGVDED